MARAGVVPAVQGSRLAQVELAVTFTGDGCRHKKEEPMSIGYRSRKCRALPARACLAALGVLALCLVASCSPFSTPDVKATAAALAHLWATQTAQVPPTPDVQATAEALAHLWVAQTAEAQPVTTVRAGDTPMPSFTPTLTPTPTTPTPTLVPSPVPSLPVIEYFRANPVTVTWGTCTNLEWGTASNATTVIVDQEIGSLPTTPGSRQVCPALTTTYVMTAVGPGGTITQSVIVTRQSSTFYRFADHMCDASWTSGAGQLTCPGGSDVDIGGFVQSAAAKVLEDGSSWPRSFEAHPQWVDDGWITGLFLLPGPIQAGDRFEAQVGLLQGAGAGDVKFVLVCGGTEPWQAVKSYNNSLLDVSVDLGQCVALDYLELRVATNGSSQQDWAVWVNPTIVRP